MVQRETVQIVEEVKTDELINEHIEKTGTDESFFINDVGDVVRKFILWNDLMPRISPFFAFKCNNHPTVAGTLAALGAGFDCASRGEIEKVLAMGVATDKIVFAQTVKPVSHINYAKERNVPLMTFDNEEELLKVKKHFSEAQLLLRLRFDPNSTNKIGFGEKFGCMPGAASEFLLQRAKDLALSVKGVAFHIGVGCLQYEIFAKAIEDSAAAFAFGKSLGLKMDLLDVGGGFPGRETDTITGVAKVINESLEKFFPNQDEVTIISEPGTYFAEAGYTLVTNVHSKNIKVDACGEETVHYYITDGIYQSFNMESTHGVDILAEPLKENPDKKIKKSIIWGRACDPHDIVMRDVFLPEMETGDWLVFRNSGAYRTTTSCSFNGFPSHPVYNFIDRKTWNTLKKLTVPHISMPFDAEEK